jgi:hypothetical protein
MKRALMVASVGFLASTAWVVAANAQANINPNVYPANTSGPYGSPSPWEWHAGPGPEKRGNMCLVQKACPAPKAAAAPAVRRKKRVVAR